jgi:hypothetical protein
MSQRRFRTYTFRILTGAGLTMQRFMTRMLGLGQCCYLKSDAGKKIKSMYPHGTSMLTSSCQTTCIRCFVTKSSFDLCSTFICSGLPGDCIQGEVTPGVPDPADSGVYARAFAPTAGTTFPGTPTGMISSCRQRWPSKCRPGPRLLSPRGSGSATRGAVLLANLNEKESAQVTFDGLKGATLWSVVRNNPYYPFIQCLSLSAEIVEIDLA